eukprot:15132330-Alexandrium_andersonii.AAC.1
MVGELGVPAGVQGASSGTALVHEGPVDLGRQPSPQAAARGPVRADGHQPASGRPAVHSRGNVGVPLVPRLAE